MVKGKHSCPVCEYVVKDESFVFCPMCAAKLGGGEEYLGPVVDRISYLWERHRDGRFIYGNFKSVRNMSGICVKKSRPVRNELGDFANIHLFSLYEFSTILCNPDFVSDYYLFGKLLGHFSAENLRFAGLNKLVNSLSKTPLFWQVFQDKRIQDIHEKGWRRVEGMLIKIHEVDKDKQRVRYIAEDTIWSPFKSSKACCFFFSGVLAGQAEALFSGYWAAVEKKCACTGNEQCVIDLHLHEKERGPKVEKFNVSEIKHILDQVITGITERRESVRKELGDTFHICTFQCVNYFMVSLSPGHRVLLKEAGKNCGRRIIEVAGISEYETVIDYLKDLFVFLKAGIAEFHAIDNVTTIKLCESVYASGVNNINMKLDVFLAGIIEGALNQTTGDKWRVEETKCIANGDDYCEFTCRRQD